MCDHEAPHRAIVGLVFPRLVCVLSGLYHDGALSAYVGAHNIVQKVVAEHLLIGWEVLSRARRQRGMSMGVRQDFVARLRESKACDRPECRVPVMQESRDELNPIRCTGIGDI